MLGQVSRIPFWLALGAELHYTIWRALRAVATVELVDLLAPADFTGAGEVVYREGGFRVHTLFGVEWVL